MSKEASPILSPEVKALFPFENHFISIDGHKMHYVDEGTGPAVLLLHGNPTWSFYYRNLITALKPHFRVIAPDYLGLGLSDHPEKKHYRASHRITHVEELIRHLGLTSYSLVMHDWGGSIGTGVAVRNPSAVRSLIFLNTTLTETETLPFIIKRAARPIIGKFLTKTTKHFLKLTTEWGVTKRLSDDVKKGYLAPYPNRKSRTAIWDFVDDIPFDSNHPSYADMLFLADNIPLLAKKPTLIVWGLQDPCFHREMLSQLARHFPHAEVVEIPHGSHLVLEDAPEIAIPAIAHFLQGKTSEEESAVTLGRDLLVERNPLYYSFLEQAEQQPTSYAASEAIFLLDDVQYRHSSFQDLKTLIYKYQRGLAQLGLVAGDRVVMLVSPGIDFLALTYAILARGATPVFLDPGMGRKKLVACIREISPQAFIGSLKAQLLRVLHKDLFTRIKFCLTASRFSLIRGRDLSFLQRFSSGPLPVAPLSDVALIAYTSGATGTPKGVIYTPQMLEAQLRIFKEAFGLEAGKRDIPLLPVFSIFNLACGIGSVFAPIDPAEPLALDPRKILRIIKDLGVHYSFGSPTLWNKLAEYCIRTREKLPSLEKIFIAGAPVSREVLLRVQEIVPKGVVYTPYGSTEALPVTIVSAQELVVTPLVAARGGEQGMLVGRAVSGVTVKIVPMSDGAIESIDEATLCAPCIIGEIVVRGANVSQRYFLRDEATRSSKIKGGWHRMGDLGYFDNEGRLYFCGRKVHAVPLGESVLYSIPTEMIFNVHPKVKRSALVRLSAEGHPAIVVEPHPQFWPASREDRKKFEEELRVLARSSPLTSPPTDFFFHHSFPVDPRHNAKIFRDKLGVWAATEYAKRITQK